MQKKISESSYEYHMIKRTDGYTDILSDYLHIRFLPDNTLMVRVDGLQLKDTYTICLPDSPKGLFECNWIVHFYCKRGEASYDRMLLSHFPASDASGSCRQVSLSNAESLFQVKNHPGIREGNLKGRAASRIEMKYKDTSMYWRVSKCAMYVEDIYKMEVIVNNAQTKSQIIRTYTPAE